MGKRRDDVPHVVALKGGAESQCLHCWEKLRLVLPMNVSVWCAAANAFVDAHKRCKPRVARHSESKGVRRG